MRLRSLRLALVLSLGCLVALAAGLSAAHAVGMAAGMTASAGMDAAGHDGCDGCGGDDGAASASCQWTCVAAAVLPSAPTMPGVEPAAAPVGRDSSADGRAAPPDPHPPRSGGLA